MAAVATVLRAATNAPGADRFDSVHLSHADKDSLCRNPSPAAPASFVIVLFAGSGTLQFIVTDLFASIIPPSLPLRREAVYISGACELTGALCLCLPRWRRLAGVGLFLLTIAVTPANIYMWLRADRIPQVAPSLLFWRLPLQLVLLAIIWRVAIAAAGGSDIRPRRAAET